MADQDIGKYDRKYKKGFTLIELLIVIAVIAVLAIAVVLALNPAEILRQSRDSTRVSDLNILKRSITHYLVDVSPANLGSSLRCYLSFASSTAASTTCATYGFFPTASGAATSSNSRLVDGNGWVPVNFKNISSGAPISSLPVDPVNNTSYFYAYISSSTSLTFKLATRLESQKYSASGTKDLASTDGGSSNAYFETGTAMGL